MRYKINYIDVNNKAASVVWDANDGDSEELGEALQNTFIMVNDMLLNTSRIVTITALQ